MSDIGGTLSCTHGSRAAMDAESELAAARGAREGEELRMPTPRSEWRVTAADCRVANDTPDRQSASDDRQPTPAR